MIMFVDFGKALMHRISDELEEHVWILSVV